MQKATAAGLHPAKPERNALHDQQAMLIPLHAPGAKAVEEGSWAA